MPENQKDIFLDNDTTKAEPGKLVQANPKITQNFVNKVADAKAVIILCLNAVMSNFSYPDSAESALLFPSMFPDSQITSSRMQLKKDKAGYTIVHDSAPYFRNQLLDTLK